MKVMALCDSGSHLFGQHGERIILALPGSASTPAAPGKDAAADRAALHHRGTQLASALGVSTLNLGGREQPLSPHGQTHSLSPWTFLFLTLPPPVMGMVPLSPAHLIACLVKTTQVRYFYEMIQKRRDLRMKKAKPTAPAFTSF